MKKVKWSREDYIRYDVDGYWWFINPQWKVIPTIAFIDGNMIYLTCKYHDGGDVNMLIHAFRWNHHVPSNQPDQKFQVLTQSRTVRKGKTSLYSTEWQTTEHHGSFGDLYT